MKHLNKIQVGLLLDDEKVPAWVYEVVHYLIKHDCYKLVFVAFNRDKSKKMPSSKIYKLLRWLDAKLMRTHNSPFERKLLDIKSVPVINVLPIKKKYSDYFPDDIVQNIKYFDPHIIIRFGFRILRGQILTASKYGILSLHHGDMQKYRGGPPAFWEVIEKSPTTSVCLQILTDKLDAGKYLDSCTLNTFSYSFYRNQYRIYWAGENLLKHNLQRMAFLGVEEYFDCASRDINSVTPGKIYKPPGAIMSVALIFWYFFNLLNRSLFRLFYSQRWQLSMHRVDYRDGSFLVKDFKKFIPEGDREWADPFAIKFNDKFYLFFEDKLNVATRAHISLLIFDSEGNLINQEPIVVLKEKWHLSYPFVFAYNNKFYMLPEAASSKKLTLYEATDFPFEWKPVRILLEDLMVYDPTLHQHADGKWYLFCTTKTNPWYSSNAYLEVYQSVNILTDDFFPHTANPIYKDVRGARPAGSLFTLNNKLIRPAQLGAPSYGSGLMFFDVTSISTHHYFEQPIKHISEFINIDPVNVHTFNLVDNYVFCDKLVSKFKFLSR